MPDYIYETSELVETITTIRTQPRFFLDRYFLSTPYLSTRSEIVFDEVLEDLPVMAPFVSPIVRAKPQRRHGFEAKTFSPAYVKPKHTVKPRDFITRSPGESLLGSMSPQERRERAVLDLLALQKRQIEARYEWMAAMAVINGAVTVQGEDYPQVLVDFGRSASHSIVLAGAGVVWSDPNTDIGSQLEEWSDRILQATGFPGTDLVMSPEAWKNFRKNDGVLADADRRRGVTSVPSLQARKAMEGARYVGQFGEFECWVYAGKFKDQDGGTSRALGAGEVIMTAAPSEESGTGGVHGIKAFGAIEDVKAGLQPIEIFPKMWEEEDPSVEHLMSQSAPLMIPGRPNAVIKVVVQ